MGAPSMTTQAPARIAEREAGESGRALSVLGVPFTLCEFDDAVEHVRDMIVTGEPHQLVLANAHTLNLAYDDPAYHRVVNDADLVLRDGVGVELAARLAGSDGGHNFVGTDFVPELLAALGPDEVRVFLFGGRPGVTEQAAHSLAASTTDIPKMSLSARLISPHDAPIRILGSPPPRRAARSVSCCMRIMHSSASPALPKLNTMPSPVLLISVPWLCEAARRSALKCAPRIAS